MSEQRPVGAILTAYERATPHHHHRSVIRRRFVAGLRNFDELYKHVVDSWMHYDNSGAAPVLVESQDNP